MNFILIYICLIDNVLLLDFHFKILKQNMGKREAFHPLYQPNHWQRWEGFAHPNHSPISCFLLLLLWMENPLCGGSEPQVNSGAAERFLGRSFRS